MSGGLTFSGVANPAPVELLTASMLLEIGELLCGRLGSPCAGTGFAAGVVDPVALGAIGAETFTS